MNWIFNMTNLNPFQLEILAIMREHILDEKDPLLLVAYLWGVSAFMFETYAGNNANLFQAYLVSFEELMQMSLESFIRNTPAREGNVIYLEQHTKH
jgi:hypothetical protein